MAARRQLSWADVHARRLARHGLVEPRPASTPAGIAAAIGGVHAQVLSAAELSLALRLPGATRSTVRSALWDERSLVKTFGPRGTVHLLPADELALWCAALSATPSAGAGHAKDVRLSAGQTDEVVAAIGDALSGAELTAEELDEAVVGRTGAWAGERVVPAFQGAWPRWRQAIRPAAHRGVLCFGPDRGRRVTYASPRRWIGPHDGVEPQAAVREVVRRYLWAYGPATPAHLARWLAAPPAWAAERFAALGDELEPVDVDGDEAWQLASDGDPPPRGASSLRLLPYFDAYVVGCHPRARVFPGAAAARALSPSGQAGNFPVLLVDGVAAGVWHARRTGRRVALTVEPLGRLPTTRRQALEAEAARVGEILEAEPRLTVGTVAVGAHA